MPNLRKAQNIACNGMRHSAIVILLFFHYSTWGQFTISAPTPNKFPADSFPRKLSQFCTGQSLEESTNRIDIRINRFQNFGDHKLIRIFDNGNNSLLIDIYSKVTYADSLIFHKTFSTETTSKSINLLFKQFDPLNLPSLDYNYVLSRHLPSIVDGNLYIVESKIGQTFSYQEFNNPEVYAKYYSKTLKQAKPFTEFITGIEKLTGVKIIDPEIPKRQ